MSNNRTYIMKCHNYFFSVQDSPFFRINCLNFIVFGEPVHLFGQTDNQTITRRVPEQ